MVYGDGIVFYYKVLNYSIDCCLTAMLLSFFDDICLPLGFIAFEVSIFCEQHNGLSKEIMGKIK